jgi:hypothetical protein
MVMRVVIKYFFLFICLIPILLLAFCQGEKQPVPENAIILKETTVTIVNGFSIGSGNYYKREHSSGTQKMSIQLSIWHQEDSSEVVHLTVFEGDIFFIGEKKYQLLQIDVEHGELGKAIIVPVN